MLTFSQNFVHELNGSTLSLLEIMLCCETFSFMMSHNVNCNVYDFLINDFWWENV